MKLNDLLLSPVPEIRDLAAQAMELRTEHLAGRLSDDEFNELLNDLRSLDHIQREMVDVEVMRELLEVANALELVRSWMP